MNRKKAIYVSLIIIALLVISVISLYLVYFPGFAICIGVLAASGFYRCINVLYSWLCDGEEETSAATLHSNHKAYDWATENDHFSSRFPYIRK